MGIVFEVRVCLFPEKNCEENGTGSSLGWSVVRILSLCVIDWKLLPCFARWVSVKSFNCGSELIFRRNDCINKVMIDYWNFGDINDDLAIEMIDIVVDLLNRVLDCIQA